MKGNIRLRAINTSVFAHFARALVVLLAVFSVGDVRADVGSSTPPHYALGASASSYDLSELEQLSLYNGHLSFRLPVRDISTGRGRGTIPISILISQMWRTGSFYVDTGYGGYYQSYPAPNWGSAVLTARPGGVGIYQTGGSVTCGYPSNYRNAYTYSHTRMVYTEPDGTEHEFRDLIHDGRTVSRPTPYCTSWRALRGSVWVTHDGSGMTFISDAPIYDDFSQDDDFDNPWMVTGWLFFKDGTRYRIVNNSAVTIYDRNGNATNYGSYTWDDHNTYHSFVDSLNRQTDLTLNWDGTIPYDTVSYKGFNNAQRTIRVWHATLDQVLRADLQPRRAKTYIELFPEMGGAMDEGPYNPPLISALELPDGRFYHFYYNHYGELSRFEMPTGGAVEYDYTPGSGVVGDPTGYSGPMAVYRQLVERRVYPNGGTGNTYESRTTYSYSSAGNGDNYGTSTTTVDTFNGGGARVAREKHYFWGVPLTGPSFGSPYGRWLEGKEFKVETLDPSGDGSYVLRRVEMQWRQRAPVGWWWGNAFSEPPNDPRVVETVTTVEPTGPNLVSKRTAINPGDPNHIGYDQYNNPTDIWEYDFGAGGPGGFIRRTHTDYVTDPAYVNADPNPAVGSALRNLPLQRWVSSDIAGSNKASLTVYDYDQYGLSDCPQIVRHDAAYSTGLTRRGNVTGVTRYANAAAGTGAVTSTLTYDIAGNVVSATDARGHTSYISYSDNFSDGNNGRNTYAYPTSSTTAVPDPTGQFASTTPLTSANVYDYSTGAVTASTDPNGKTTTYDYTDPLERLKVVARPDGGTTSYHYDRSVNAGLTRDYVRTLTALDATRFIESYQFYDGLGRPSRTFLHEGGSQPAFLTTDTQYEALGRVWRVSNPYRSSGAHEDINPSGRWTTIGYDGLGRKSSVTTPDGATVTTSFVGDLATASDQTLRKRRSKTDALGRVVRIDEPDASGNLGAPDAPAQPTHYTYDALGNLRKVDQGGQLRFFMFDSLSRLVRVKHPEQAAGSTASNITDPLTLNGQWSMAYGYDENGNLTARVDARNVTTTYGYDALNRNTTVRYTDGTKDVDRHYDGAVNGRGRFYYSNWDSSNNTRFDTHLAIDQYDTVGRPLNYRQHFLTNGTPSPQFNVTFVYDKAGNVTSQTYPSGHAVTYSYDAAGRPSGFAGNLGDGVQRTYATGISYSEFGGIQQELFGTQTPLYHKLHYNRRGQLFDIRLSTVPWATDQWNWNRGAVVNYYSGNYAWEGDPNTPAGTDNNGNLRRQQSWFPGDDNFNGYAYAQDTFDYDPLNRLTQVTEVHGGGWGQSGTDFAQVYGYDRWGNRTINPATTDGMPEPQFDLTPAGDYREVPEPSNRLYAAGDNARLPQDKLMRYDAAGNLIFDGYNSGQGGGGARVYDAEHRMTAAVDRTGNWAYYTYDADGRRVKRKIANEEWWQVYGPGGELLAEYPAGAAPFLAGKEYGYRGGELLVTMSSGDVDRLRRFVKNLYYNCLARDPSPAELQQRMNELAQAGAQGGEAQLLTTARAIARALFESTEYVNRNRTTEQYVTDLYNAYLQRGPDAGGLNHWVGNTNQWGRAATLSAFELCTEFEVLSATVYGTAAGGEDQRVDTFVRNFYYGAFQREPNATEAQTGRQRLNNAAAVSRDQVIAEAQAMGVELIQSSNYISYHTVDQYVTDLYQAFLQRAPDGLGLSHWVNHTNQYGRAATLDAFKWATEYRELAGTLHRETFWLVPDHLGTPRMVVGRTGSLASVKRHDYLPFGEELGVGVGGRELTQGYGTDDHVRQKLVTNERDGETGLDFFGMRYYASGQGRFTSVDAGAFSLTTPQGLNRYASCLNNPVRYVDPDGLYNRDVHFDLTRVLALAAGFSDADATAIAAANQRVDDHWSKSPMPGWRQGSGYRNRKKYHFTTAKQRQNLFDKFSASGSIDDLGVYLHAMQDKYPHKDFPAWSGQIDLGRPTSEWDDVDDTWRDAEMADAMAKETYDFLADCAGPIMEDKGTARRGPTVPWGMISGLVHDFNAAQTMEEKRYILGVMETRIRLHIQAEMKKKMQEANRTRKRQRGRHEE